MIAIDWTSGIEEAWNDLASFVPKLVAAIVVFLIGWFIAKFIRKLIERALTAIKFDSYIDKSGLGAPLEKAGWADSGKLLAALLYIGLMILVLQLTIDVFGESAISEAFESMLAFIPKVFIAAIIIVLTGVVANTVRRMLGPAVSHQSGGEFLTKVAFFGIWVIGGFAAIDQLEIAENVVDTLFSTISYSLGLIVVIKFGVGGIWAARDRFWPAVYDSISSDVKDTDSE